MEYWAVIWGAVLMGVTGFMLWNPIATARFLPGEFIPAAKAAHSAEALLAVLAVLIWHFYWVHIKTFNRSMFTGKLSQEQMEEEHAAELKEIEVGPSAPPLPRQVKRNRERVFLPVATLASLVAVFGLYTFITFEETAITTVPPAETVQAFLPATPTPTRTPTLTPTPTQAPIPSPTQVGGEATPAAPQPEGVPVIPHPMEGREDCLLCHALDLLPESHQAAEFASAECLLCHTEGEASGTEGAAVGFAGQVHPLLEANCATCHGETALGGLQVTEYEALMAGGQSGPVVVAGSPKESLMVTKMQDEHPAVLSDDDLQTLIDWIAGGAKDN
jgi:hypothetical protein